MKNMKNMKKISLVSFLACACLTGGIMMANTGAPVEPEKYFRMEAGAQVRVPDTVEEGAEDFDGLRFTAKMSDSFWQEKGKMEDLSVGMFILPALYAEGRAINYDNCFGESACYYWAGKEVENTDGKKEILHVESYAYEEYAGAPELTMKASIWNMNAENLNREFVAVAYLTDGTNYWFAETAQGAKTVSVAQKALLNPEDEIYSVDGAPAKVESAYVNAYLGEGKEVAYTVNAYKEQKDGTYALVEETRTEIVTSYNQMTSVKAPEKYNEWTANENNGADATILFDGTTEVTKYYNYTGDRVVLWDGDTKVADNCSFIVTNDKPAGTEPEHVVSNTTISEGKSGMITMRQAAWAGPWWTNAMTLGMYTDTFTMDVYCVNEIPELTLEVHVVRNDGGRRYIGYKHPVALEGGKTHNITITLKEKISHLLAFSFLMRQANASIYFDNICAVGDSFVHDALPYTYTDSISFAKSDINSNALWDGEEFAVSYKKAGAEDYTDLTAVDGVYTIAPEAGSNYELKFTNGDKSFTHTVVPDAHIAHFDEVGEKWYSLRGTDYGDGTALQDGNGDAVMARAHAGDSFYFHHYNLFIMRNGDNNMDPVMSGKIGLWIFAEKDVAIGEANRPWFRVNDYPQTTETTYKAGYHYYEFTLAEVKAGERGLQFNAMSNIGLYIDAVAFIK